MGRSSCIRTVLCSLAAGLLLGLAVPTVGLAQKKADPGPVENPDITVQVDGLSCPFCAYGLEKKLKNLEGVNEVGVLLEKGQVQLVLAEGAQLSEEQIRAATEKAGFKARKITFANEAARSKDAG